MALIKRTLDLVVEPSGAVGIAALMVESAKARYAGTDQGPRNVGVILSGGNVDRDLFDRLTANR